MAYGGYGVGDGFAGPRVGDVSVKAARTLHGLVPICLLSQCWHLAIQPLSGQKEAETREGEVHPN